MSEPIGDVTESNCGDDVVRDFGDEWSRFDQSKLSSGERDELAGAYFAAFPWHELPTNPVGADIGCGSGRWATWVAPRVGQLTCIDASEAAVAVARRNLGPHANCTVVQGSVDAIPIPPESLDFVYSLGVLHHVPDTQSAIDNCVRLLRPGGVLLVYLYYSMENRPAWYRALWRTSDALRRLISASPRPIKNAVCEVMAFTVYWPLARLARAAEAIGLPAASMPLASYRRLSLYTMRTDARDRFGTRLESRFSRAQVTAMLSQAGLVRVEVPEAHPYWTGLGRRPLDGGGLAL